MTPNSTDRLGPVSPLESLAAAVHAPASAVQSPNAFESILNHVSGHEKAEPHRRPIATQRSKSSGDDAKSLTRQTEESSSGEKQTARSVARKQSAKTSKNSEPRRADDGQERGADPAEEGQAASAAGAPPPNSAPAEMQKNQGESSGEAAESNPLYSAEGAGEGNTGTKQQASIALVDVLVDAVPQTSEEVKTQSETEPTAESDAKNDTLQEAAVEEDAQITTTDVVLPVDEIAAGSTSMTTISSSTNEGHAEARSDVDADSEGAPQPESPIVAIDAAQAQDPESDQADRHTQKPEEPSTSEMKERSQLENQVDAPLLPTVPQDQAPTPAQDATAAQTQAQAQATSAPQPAKEGPAATTGSGQASNGQGPAARLPPHVMARPETRRNHAPAPVEIDSTRFLSRVARAFNAAQQRGGEVRLRLSPPELGSLRLQVSVQDGVMVARMETETEAARASLVSSLPALRERLAEQGIRVERFDIDLMQQSSSGTPDRPNDPQQREDAAVRPFRPLVSSAIESSVPAPASSSWNGQGRLNVII